MSVNPKPQSNKSQPPLLKNAAAAPFVYFDLVPVFGIVNGVVELELAAQVLVPKPDGAVGFETVCVAHLRGSFATMEGLSDAIDKALDMARLATASENGNRPGIDRPVRRGEPFPSGEKPN
jgi:hypothetical protein